MDGDSLSQKRHDESSRAIFQVRVASRVDFLSLSVSFNSLVFHEVSHYENLFFEIQNHYFSSISPVGMSHKQSFGSRVSEVNGCKIARGLFYTHTDIDKFLRGINPIRFHGIKIPSIQLNFLQCCK